MPNKRFRMEKKKLGTSVCADISHYALKNQYVLFDKKSRNGCKSIVDECGKKIIKHFAKKKFYGVQKCQK